MFQEQNVQNRNLGVLSLEGSPEPLLATEFNERDGEISPDGRWLAYQSDASGQNENYVRPFPTVEDGQWLISSGGGSRPLWAPNDRNCSMWLPRYYEYQQFDTQLATQCAMIGYSVPAACSRRSHSRPSRCPGWRRLALAGLIVRVYSLADVVEGGINAGPRSEVDPILWTKMGGS